MKDREGLPESYEPVLPGKMNEIKKALGKKANIQRQYYGCMDTPEHCSLDGHKPKGADTLELSAVLSDKTNEGSIFLRWEDQRYFLITGGGLQPL